MHWRQRVRQRIRCGAANRWALLEDERLKPCAREAFSRDESVWPARDDDVYAVVGIRQAPGISLSAVVLPTSLMPLPRVARRIAGRRFGRVPP